MEECANLPKKFLERLQKLFSDTQYSRILKVLSQNQLPSFRANTLKLSAAELQNTLTDEGFEIEQVPWYQDAFILKNKSIRELTETDAYKQGLLYIQNLSSMIPALVLDPKPGDLVLDMAAAPGSKTTQIAALMDNTGLIVANDISRQRLYKMQSLLNHYAIPFQWQISTRGVYIISSRGETLWKKFPNYFDKVLVDAPCSMEGRIRCDDPKTYQDWSPKKIKQLSMLQKYMLRSAISATRPGGVIVYATCTLSPEENEEVIDWILKREQKHIAIEQIHIPGLSLAPGISRWNKSFNPHVTLTSRISPTPTMEGFFVAKIRKVATSEAPMF